MPLVAYIDPGSGTLLLQVILAGALAVPFFFRRVIADGWRRIRGEDAPTPTSSSTGSSTETED
jgi:hypothetical protein